MVLTWVCCNMISDTNTPYGSCVRLQGKSLALSEYQSSNVETVAEIFLWCGVTPSKYSQPARQGKAGQPRRKAGKNTSMFRWLTTVLGWPYCDSRKKYSNELR